LGAAFIDHWVITGPFVLIPIVEPALGIDIPAPTWAYFLIYLGYFTILESVYGTTPGKTVLNLRVVGSGGDSISWRQSALRNILRVVDFLPWLYAVGAVAIWKTERNQRVGDLVAETRVTPEPRNE
jgi:uncharacterized RDD family membrane protein YckC